MAGKTVLLVAGGDNGGRLQKLLEENGYETREAENEKRALELWSEQEADYVLMAGREAERSWIGKLREGQSGYLTDSAGRLRIDLKKHLVELDDAEIQLTPTEYELLVVMVRSPNRIFTREQLIACVFEEEYRGYDRSIDTHIKELRRKLKENGRNPRYICTVHGVGYKFVP